MKRTIGILAALAAALALLVVCSLFEMRRVVLPARPEPGIGVYGGGPRTLWEGNRPMTNPPDRGPQSRF